ncbi:rSAM-modified peptide [Arenibacter sp. 6A1]|uniref:TIGR04149 family rSAM-modified RiPP n=1 Tax=Arenibacter sp. 6A1 TaxID=2720391 RepID=UPI001447293C|nr:TIGR04149 family rSAM-modified RiPP [Arenibacter sp. 6A1]NKI24937.1 rSAM-modified peptide [Arenibacter sp. 6A1]
MKKLRLIKLKLETNDLLNREQLKTVLGGGYSSGCNADSGCSTGCSSFVSEGEPRRCNYCCVAA